jgi:hypothetical protein
LLLTLKILSIPFEEKYKHALLTCSTLYTSQFFVEAFSSPIGLSFWRVTQPESVVLEFDTSRPWFSRIWCFQSLTFRFWHTLQSLILSVRLLLNDVMLFKVFSAHVKFYLIILHTWIISLSNCTFNNLLSSKLLEILTNQFCSNRLLILFSVWRL